MSTVTGKKVSIVLIHYNQMDYINGAILSVLKQKYKNIELIIADDASTDLDLDGIKEFIKKENKNKFEVKYSLNKENVGTVKNINNSMKYVTGDYLLIFAADDELYDDNAIGDLVKFYDKQDDDVSIVFGQCFMMDHELKELKSKYVDLEEAKRFNKMSAFEQYSFLALNCFAAMGACMLSTSILKNDNLFDERFKYIEDWTYFLKTTSNNRRMKFVNVNTLLHRDGGISHNEEVTDLKIAFNKELLKIIELYAFPRFSEFSNLKKEQIVNKYVEHKGYIRFFGSSYDDIAYKKLKAMHLLFFVKRKAKQINNEFKARYLKQIRRFESFLVFTILMLLLNKHFDYKYEVFFVPLLVLFSILTFFVLIRIICIVSIRIISKIRRMIR